MDILKNSEWDKRIENVAMNIVYQLDDDSGASVEFRQANNDKRIDFVMRLISSLLQERSKNKTEELVEKVEGLRKNIGYSDEEKDMPTIENELVALAFESNADAFFAGYDRAVDRIKVLLAEQLNQK